MDVEFEEADDWREGPEPRGRAGYTRGASAPPRQTPARNVYGGGGGPATPFQGPPLKMASFFFLIGIVIVFVGIIIGQSASFMNPPDPDDFSGDETGEDYNDAVDRYYDATRVIGASSSIVSTLGLMFVALAPMSMALTRDEVDWKIRAVLIIAGMVLLTFILLVAF